MTSLRRGPSRANSGTRSSRRATVLALLALVATLVPFGLASPASADETFVIALRSGYFWNPLGDDSPQAEWYGDDPVFWCDGVASSIPAGQEPDENFIVRPQFLIQVPKACFERLFVSGTGDGVPSYLLKRAEEWEGVNAPPEVANDIYQSVIQGSNGSVTVFDPDKYPCDEIYVGVGAQILIGDWGGYNEYAGPIPECGASAALDQTLGLAPTLVGFVGDPVNTYSGNFVDQRADLDAPSASPGLELTRTYNAMDDLDHVADGIGQTGILGPKVTTTWDESLIPGDYSLDPMDPEYDDPGADAGLVYRGPDGSRTVLPPVTPGSPGWEVPEFLDLTVSWDEVTRKFTVRHTSGAVSTFDDAGLLLTKQELGQDVVTVCRDVDRRPTKVVLGTDCVTSSPAYRIDLIDNATADGLYDQVRLVQGASMVIAQVDYAYADGVLASASTAYKPGETPGGFEFGYTDGLMTSITQKYDATTDVPVITSSYDALGRVTEQFTPDGEHLSFDYGGFDGGSATTAVTWCSGWDVGTASCAPGATTESVEHVHNADGRLVSQRDTNGSQTDRVVSDGDRILSSVDRTGTASGAAYDDWGRLVQSATADPVTGFVPPLPASAGPELCKRNLDDTFSFPAPGAGACAGKNFTVESYTYCTATSSPVFDPRVATSTDPLGNVTRYLYGSTNTSSPCTATVLAQSTPTRVIDPTGAITDFQTLKKSGADTGLVSRAIDPDKVVTRWIWNVDRRLLLGDSVGNNWTYYGYDAMGRQTVTRTPLGIETWTVYDGAGQVVETVGPVQGPARSCNTTTGCAFPASIDVNGPTVRSEHWLDGSLKSRQERVNRATVSDRTWEYYTGYFTGYFTPCTPPAAGCERRETELEPPRAFNPANPSATTRTFRMTRFNTAGRPYSVVTGDTAGATASAGTATNYQSNPSDPGTNLGLGRVYSQVSPAGVASTNGYDGNLTGTGNAAVSGNGLVTSTGIGAAPLVVSTKVYDKLGRVIEERGPVVTNESGASVASCARTAYDAAGRVSLRAEGAGVGALGGGCAASGSTALIRTKTFYDAASRPTHEVVDLDGDGTITDPTTCSTVDTGDVVTQTVFTPGGRSDKTIEAPVDVTAFNWCTGTGKRETDSTFDTSASVDNAKTGRLVSVTPPAGSGMTVAWTDYDADSRVTEVRQMAGATKKSYTKSTYDVAGRVLTRSVPSPTGTGDATTVSCYDAFGQLTYTSDAHTGVNLTTPCGSDGLGADKTTFKQWQSFSYYADGSAKDSWSALRNNAAVTNPDWAKATLFYDGRGNRTARVSWTKNSATDTYHQVTEKWEYYADDQLSAYTDPIQAAATTPLKTTYSYYGNAETGLGQLPGKVKTIAYPSGRNVTAGYRPDGQVAQQQFRDTVGGAVVETVAFGYDALGRRTKAANNATGTMKESAFTYDRAGRMLTQVTPNLNDGTTSTTTWSYDLSGNQREMRYPNGTRLQFDHDSLDRLTATKFYWGTTCCVTFESAVRDDLGRVTSQNLLTSTSSQYRQWTYQANGAPQATQYSELISDTPTNKSVLTTMAHRADGRLASETTSAETWTYAYDEAGQLTGRTGGATAYAYTYNTRGMRLSQTVGSITTAYAYDNNAQMLSADASTGPDTTYQWDLDGRRTVADTGTGAGRTKVDTTYDARGLVRQTKTYLGTTTTPNKTITWNQNADGLAVRTLEAGSFVAFDAVWDPTQPVPQIISSRLTATVSISNFYGLSRLGNLTMNGTAGALAWYATDAHGSVLKTSAIAAPVGYTPYGAPRTTDTGPMTYRGELTTDGLIYLRARTYDPVAGVFTSRDPLDGIVGTPTLTNPYHYTDNDPLNKIDPTGMYSMTDLGFKVLRPALSPSHSAYSSTGRWPNSTRCRTNHEFEHDYRCKLNPMELRFVDVLATETGVPRPQEWASEASMYRVAIEENGEVFPEFSFGPVTICPTVKSVEFCTDLRGRIDRSVDVSVYQQETTMSGGFLNIKLDLDYWVYEIDGGIGWFNLEEPIQVFKADWEDSTAWVGWRPWDSGVGSERSAQVDLTRLAYSVLPPCNTLSETGRGKTCR